MDAATSNELPKQTADLNARAEVETDATLSSVREKTSRAPKLWLGLLVLVLLLLYVETRTKPPTKLNFFLNTDSESIGAEVLIDHEKVGAVQKSEASGIGGGVFWTFLRDGKHLVEIKKADFDTYSKEIEIKKEEYLGVDLKRANH